MSEPTEIQVVDKLQAEVSNCGSIYEFAKKHNISPSYISEVLRKKRYAGKKILKALGLKKVSKYEEDV